MNYTEMSADDLRDFATTDGLIEAVVALREERDALAAHVERLNANAEHCADELAAMIDRHNTQNMEDGSWEYDHQTPHELMIAVREAPATSLDRLKPEWQAEAIWQFITEIEKSGWETAPALVVTALYTRCAELRRQAEEADQ